MTGLDFGSLNDALAEANPWENLNRSLAGEPDDVQREVAGGLRDEQHRGTVNMMRSAGPVSDAYILGTDRVMNIAGPQGSGKTIASVKKSLVEAQRIRPGADGIRRYKLGVFRQKYDNLWKATIPSWWKVLPKDLAGSSWTGASPRAARHVVRFQDRWGDIEMIADFIAFGEVADPEDLRGLEFFDVYLNEMDTMPEELLTWLFGRIGRDPPPEIAGRRGRVFGDMNAPDILNWTYRMFYEEDRDGWRLYRQPGGREEGAENLQALGGRGYYEEQALNNAHNPWWVRRMVDGIPGMSRSTDLVYDKFDDVTMHARVELKPEAVLPVLVGVDGGLTPAAVYCQEMNDGQLRILAEIALERGGMIDLGNAMLALEKRRFGDCEFRTVCDPAMKAGEDDGVAQAQQRVTKASNRQELAEILGRPVELAVTQEPSRRWAAVRDKIAQNLGPQRPGLIADPSCKGLARGFLQTYHFRKLRGTNDLSSVQPTFDTHVHDALQYAALECGSDAARKRKSDAHRERNERREKNRDAPRYNPNSYAHRRSRG